MFRSKRTFLSHTYLSFSWFPNRFLAKWNATFFRRSLQILSRSAAPKHPPPAQMTAEESCIGTGGTDDVLSDNRFVLCEIRAARCVDCSEAFVDGRPFIESRALRLDVAQPRLITDGKIEPRNHPSFRRME